MTERQALFYKLYMSGHSMRRIAREYGVCRTTVYRTILAAEKNIRDVERVKKEIAERR